MADTVCVRFSDGTSRSYPKGSTLLQISQDFHEKYATPIIVARVDNNLKDLQFPVQADCRVEFFDLTSGQGMKTYERTLVFVMVLAAEEAFPGMEVKVEHSFGDGIYCEFNQGEMKTAEEIAVLTAQMRKIVAENHPILRRWLTKEVAIDICRQAGLESKVKVLEQVERECVVLYECRGRFNYFYGKMAPSTGYVSTFHLEPYRSGFVLRLPTKESHGCIPAFKDQPKLAEIFAEADGWGKVLRCSYLSTLNEHIQDGTAGDIVRVAEALQEKKLAQIADYITTHQNKVRVILIAGPSSSGKTTFAQRLAIQLRVNGIRPISISLDDYFVDRDRTPRDEKGDYDFESIEAIDLELFNTHLLELLQGQEVKIPAYNFMTGSREYRGRRLHLSEDQMLIIEGIHGLNEHLSSAVPREQKVKIYVSAITQLSIDNHNRIPTTDTRLIRRIVRDSQFRAHDALRTLQLWPAVRKGEERNIFPFQEDADVMFNSALIYELGVLKRYAEPLLQQVGEENPEYVEAQRLLDFMAHCKAVDADEVPLNSILREFVGNSCFQKE